MTIGPVSWGAYTGEFLEIVMAVLLAEEQPDLIRRTPASGDGGETSSASETAGTCGR